MSVAPRLKLEREDRKSCTLENSLGCLGLRVWICGDRSRVMGCGKYIDYRVSRYLFLVPYRVKLALRLLENWLISELPKQRDANTCQLSMLFV